jgi:hypothetical protein
LTQPETRSSAATRSCSAATAARRQTRNISPPNWWGRYLIDRAPLPALALTVDTSALTAIANDYSYDEVFARQLAGLGQPGDVLVALSTSGNSKNVLRAIEVARDKSIRTIGLTGQSGGLMRQLCDICICVPSDRTNHIQEMHIAVGHVICGAVERRTSVARSDIVVIAQRPQLATGPGHQAGLL